MNNILPQPDDVMKGKVDYYFPELARDVRTYIDAIHHSGMKKYDKNYIYKNALMVIMLSSEEKTAVEIAEALGQREEFVRLGQELFYDFINVCQGIHMRMFLDIMEKYSTDTHMTITLLNIEIKKFIHQEACSE